MSASDPGVVAIWCHLCKAFVNHHGVVYSGKKPLIVHVTPAVLAQHRATHEVNP